VRTWEWLDAMPLLHALAGELTQTRDNDMQIQTRTTGHKPNHTLSKGGDLLLECRERVRQEIPAASEASLPSAASNQIAALRCGSQPASWVQTAPEETGHLMIMAGELVPASWRVVRCRRGDHGSDES